MIIETMVSYESFREYCKGRPGTDVSSVYTCAITYLLDYLHLKINNINLIKELEKYENDISDKNSDFYTSFSQFLVSNGHGSYLSWLPAALRYFYRYLQENLTERPVFFAKVVWMSNYQGIERFDKTDIGYPKQYQDAGEKFNFRVKNGKVYGYFEGGNGRIDLERIANYYHCKIIEKGDQRYLENVDVIFFAKNNTLKNPRVIGFYRQARVYEEPKEVGDGNLCYFECQAGNEFLIPVTQRDCEIPKIFNQVDVYGQNFRCYMTEPELRPLVERILAYIDKFAAKQKQVTKNEIENKIASELINYHELSVTFDRNQLLGEMPLGQRQAGKTSSTRIFGTARIAVNKMMGGRKAEKYFMQYLSVLGFREREDFQDVANNQHYGYDVCLFGNLGFEIKNIRNGYFYLSDCEIEQINNDEAYLILVDINNGIWLVKKDDLSTIFDEMKQIKIEVAEKYAELEVNEIKILTQAIKENAVLISTYTKEQFLELIL